jgi:hypothetical protein
MPLLKLCLRKTGSEVYFDCFIGELTMINNGKDENYYGDFTNR